MFSILPEIDDVKKYIVISLIIIPASLSSGIVYAADVFAPQRELFARVEGDMKHGDFRAFHRYAARLSGYPLFPYLEFYELRRRLATATESEIRTFLHKYERVPIGERLRHEWIIRLARQGKWQTIAEIYQTPRMLEGKDVKCHYARALFHTRRFALLRKVVADLWTVGFSQPKACDFVFNWGFVDGVINDAMVWKRLLLVINKNPGLARYLGGRLSIDQRQWYRMLAAAPNNAETTLSNLKRMFSSSPMAKDVALAALKALAKRNIASADRHFNQLRAVCPRCPDMYIVQREWGMFLARRLQSELAYAWLVRLPAENHTEHSVYWQIRSALRQEDWQHVLQSIATLDDHQRNLPQWRYWYARALYQTGQIEKALEIWKALSAKPDYYGYLAADKVGADYRLTTPPISYSRKDLAKFESRTAIARMRELILQQRWVDARREFLFVADTLTKQEYLKLAMLAQQWGWYDGAIRAIAASDTKTDMRIRFPVPYLHQVRKIAQRTQVPAEWIYGIMRRESAFMEKVKSPAGALGLMQLMPNTARIMSSALNLSRQSQWQILNPDINILLGASYFARLYKQYDRQMVLALAAYNAGGTYVRRWMNNTPVGRYDVWVDTIPLDETRLYVRAVLFYMTVYAHRLGGEVPRLEDLM